VQVTFDIKSREDVNAALNALAALGPVFAPRAPEVAERRLLEKLPSDDTTPRPRKAKSRPDPAAEYEAMTGTKLVETQAESVPEAVTEPEPEPESEPAPPSNVVQMPVAQTEAPAEPDDHDALIDAVFRMCQERGFTWARDEVLQGKYPTIRAIPEAELRAVWRKHNAKAA
jgi:hypothetical protein